MERIKISFQKNLNRVNYFINQLLCWFGFLISITSTYIIFLATFISRQQNQPYTLMLTTSLAVVLIFTTYLIALWATNVQGRFNNLQISNKAMAWLLYILAFATLLPYCLYFLPPGFFAKNFLKGKKHEATN